MWSICDHMADTFPIFDHMADHMADTFSKLSAMWSIFDHMADTSIGYVVDWQGFSQKRQGFSKK
jgi:hypothetical protein